MLANHYDVTLITLRPGTQAQALAALKDSLAAVTDLRVCWYSELGALNQILIISKAGNADTAIARRFERISATNPFGIGELITGMSMDSYVSFDFVGALEPGIFGPYFEVRTYILKAGGVAPTAELWRKAVPGRAKLSPLLAAMVSVTGPVTRFIHIWPYKSLDERISLRAQAIAEGVWPPPGGPSYFASQQSEIFLPAAFSPIR
jgi:hypothetical protein